MNIKEISRQLLPMFQKTPVVFWDDDGGEFSEILQDLPLEENGIILVRRNEISDLALKVRIILESAPDSHFLLYSQSAVPSPEKDWLLDIRMWAGTFHADSEALILREIGLEEKMYLRPHIRARKIFFTSKERTAKLKQIISPDMGEEDLDLVMATVIVRCDRVELSDILLRISIDWYAERKDGRNLWEELKRFGLDLSIMRLTKRKYGYPRAEEDSFRPDGFVRCLFVTDLSEGIKIQLPVSLQGFDLGTSLLSNPKHSETTLSESTPQFSREASLFCNMWRGDLVHHKDYVQISRVVEKELDIQNLMAELIHRETKKHRETASKSLLLGRCSTFESLERIVIRDIIENAESGAIDELRSRIETRAALFWTEFEDEGVKPYRETYRGLKAMLEIRALRERYAGGLHFKDAAAFVQAYTGILFRFDQCYRHFRLALDRVAGYFDVLKTASDMVEEWITHSWTRNVAEAWEQFFTEPDGLLSEWDVPDVPRQRDFYASFPGSTQSSNRARFVIISDALRYEIAEELTKRINSISSTGRFHADIRPMLGSLPSITRVGMAALLPHQRMTFGPDSSVFVDGMPTATLEQRDAVMKKYGGRAVLLDDLKQLKQDEARALVHGARVVYIYHNLIDSRGDQSGTEGQTFSAAAEAIDDLTLMVKFIINRLNGNRIYITADHGFLYQDRNPDSADRATIERQTPEAIVKNKKRYALGHGLHPSSSSWHGRTAKTAGVDDGKGMEFLVPKGAGRYHFMGGARFTHGGAMPQEVILPLVSVVELEGGKKKEVKKVSIQLLGVAHPRITSNAPHFELVQAEKISDRMLAQTIEIFLASGTSVISDVQVLEFNSSSDNIDDRRRGVSLLLKNGSYDPYATYHLVLREKERKIELERIPVTIDILIPSLF